MTEPDASDASLNEFERDALTEIVNIGVSRAAVNLRKMVGQQVILSVPSLELITRTAAAKLVRERDNDELIAVCQDFEGAFSGRALLIFPEASSLTLVRAVAGVALSGEEAVLVEDEALAETGNVVLNGCLASMANMLKKSLTLSLPQVIRGGSQILFELDSQATPGSVVLFSTSTSQSTTAPSAALHSHADGRSVDGNAEDLDQRIHRPGRWRQRDAVAGIGCMTGRRRSV